MHIERFDPFDIPKKMMMTEATEATITYKGRILNPLSYTEL
jgi:hypothetical protein